MSNTTNLDLENIEMTDIIKNGLKDKINNNMQKLDIAYGTLKSNLLVNTGKSTLSEAINEVLTMKDEIDRLNGIGNATADDILPGKTALVKGEVITGALEVITKKINNITVSGTYSDGTYHSAIEAFYSENGDVGIIIKSAKNTSYENMYFTLSEAPAGINLRGITPYYYSSASSYGDEYIAILSGVINKVNVNIDMSSRNSSGDYIQCDITITEV